MRGFVKCELLIANLAFANQEKKIYDLQKNS